MNDDSPSAGDPVPLEPAARRRRRAGAAAGIALVVAGGAIALQLVGPGSATPGAADRASSTEPSAEATHALTVRPAVVPDAPIAYDEGALVEVAVVPATPGVATPRRRSPADAGSVVVWTDLAAGTYVVTIATRGCQGNCDYLDPATDACRSTVDLRADTEVDVTIHWGRPCVVSEVGPWPT